MSDFRYLRVLQAVTATPWAILPGKLAIIRDLLAFRAAGGELSADEVRERIDAARPRPAPGATNGDSPSGAGVAVLSMVGTIIPRADLISESSGALSVQRFTRAFRQALADPEIGAIVLDVDSPGGQVGGVPELAAEIFEARGVKPVTAVANQLAASAAYWLAAAADELVVVPSGEVGSIGVFAMHQDISGYLENEGVKVDLIHAGKFKVEGNPYEALSEEARGAIQGRVDEYYEMFTADVARFRGVPVGAVVDGFGEGRCVGAKTAVSLGMADRVATLDEVVGELLRRASTGSASGASAGSASGDVERRKRRLRLNM